MLLGVRREPAESERRVALVPAGVEKLRDRLDVVVASGAGLTAGFDDDAYKEAGAAIGTPDEVAAADIAVGIAPEDADGAGAKPDGWSIALYNPLWDPSTVATLGEAGRSIFSLDLVPRSTKAQSMDVLSSMATIAGYEAALLGAARLPRLFPMMMTAAGTLTPARVLVLGAGVAGLQAIATARRLGAVVWGYDIRPAAAEQIRSVGAKVVEEPEISDESEDAGGYAREQTDDQGARQRALLSPHVADADVLITTAAVPGRASPLLVTGEMVAGMDRGSVVVDLAAERGGNVEPSMADEEVVHEGVVVLGPTDLPSRAAGHASEMFSNNIVNLLTHLLETADGHQPDLDDEITAAMLVAHGGAVRNERVLEALGVTGNEEEGGD
ncbi:MAG: NAD(P) transhydrogenase subunit alpha [Actinomycetota bacterium]